MKNGSCPKCASKEIAENLSLADFCDLYTAFPQAFHVQTTPQNMIMKGVEKFETRAWICCDCGFIEYYLDKPSHFSKAYKQHMENKS